MSNYGSISNVKFLNNRNEFVAVLKFDVNDSVKKVVKIDTESKVITELNLQYSVKNLISIFTGINGTALFLYENLNEMDTCDFYIVLFDCYSNKLITRVISLSNNIYPVLPILVGTNTFGLNYIDLPIVTKSKPNTSLIKGIVKSLDYVIELNKFSIINYIGDSTLFFLDSKKLDSCPQLAPCAFARS